MTLSYAIELVMATAVGLAVVLTSDKTHNHDPDFHSYPRWIQYGAYLSDFGQPFCAGLALVEGAALWVERARRKPFVWGIGRVTWALVLFVVVFEFFKDFVWNAAREVEWIDGPVIVGPILKPWWDMFRYETSHLVARSGLPLCLMGLLVTSLAARWPRDPSPDAREWAGRIFFGTILLLDFTYESLGWYWE